MSREPADWPSKRVIITTAATGIGLAIAKTFHALGAKVWISDIAADKLNDAKAAMPGCGAKLCDVAKPDQVEAFVEASTKAKGISCAEREAIALKAVSLKTMVDPEEIADLILFLCAPTGRAITGQLHSICGGLKYTE